MRANSNRLLAGAEKRHARQQHERSLEANEDEAAAAAAAAAADDDDDKQMGCRRCGFLEEKREVSLPAAAAEERNLAAALSARRLRQPLDAPAADLAARRLCGRSFSFSCSAKAACPSRGGQCTSDARNRLPSELLLLLLLRSADWLAHEMCMIFGCLRCCCRFFPSTSRTQEQQRLQQQRRRLRSAERRG